MVGTEGLKARDAPRTTAAPALKRSAKAGLHAPRPPPRPRAHPDLKGLRTELPMRPGRSCGWLGGNTGTMRPEHFLQERLETQILRYNLTQLRCGAPSPPQYDAHRP